MIEFYIKENISTDMLFSFLSDIFEYPKNKVFLCSFHEPIFYTLDDLKLENIPFLCLFDYVTGNVSLVIKLFRIHIDQSKFHVLVQEKIKNFNFSCYFLLGEFDDAIKINKNGCIYGNINEELSIEGTVIFNF